MPPALVVLASHLILIAGSAVLCELLARAGAGLLPWWRGVPTHALTRWGLSVLAGVMAWGLLNLGLALAGLFYPSVLAVTAVGAAIAVPFGRRRTVLWLDAAREWARVGWLPAAALATGFTLVAIQAFVREAQFDSLVYHLGVASQYLCIHRAVLSDASLAFQFSLPVEMTYALPVALGDDRLARVLTILTFIAACAVAGGRALARRRPAEAWIGPLLVLAAPTVVAMVPMAKNDITASAWFIAGALLTTDGRWGLGATFLGCAVAGKVVYGLPVAIWCLATMPPPSRWFRVGAGLVLPGLGWWLKTWLATGTPVFPTTAGRWPSPFWGTANALVWDVVLRRDWPANTLSVFRLPGAFLEQMRSDYLLALLLLPGLFVFGPRGRRLAGIGLGMFVVLATAHNARYLLPLAWWLVLEETGMLGRIPGRGGTIAGPALAGLVLSGLVLDPLHLRPTLRSLAGTPATHWGEFTTQRETVEHLKKVGVRRMVVVGDLRSYPWPARILYDGAIGETPLTWAFAHASRSPADIRKKFRQTGASCLIYNYVSVGFIVTRYAAFPWRDDALRRYVAFCKQYLVREWGSATTDFANGGFYQFDLLPRALPHPPATTWFAPGTESIYWPGLALHLERKSEEALAELKSVLKRLPDVGVSWNLIGHEYASYDRWREAYPYLDKFGAAGMRDDVNLTEYAVSLIAVGRIPEAEAALAEAVDRYPAQRIRMTTQLAGLLADRSQEDILNGRIADAAARLPRAEALFSTLVPNADPVEEPKRVQLSAYLIGLRGEIWLAYGNGAKALDCFARSLRIDDTGPMSRRWKTMLKASGSSFPGQ